MQADDVRTTIEIAIEMAAALQGHNTRAARGATDDEMQLAMEVSRSEAAEAEARARAAEEEELQLALAISQSLASSSPSASAQSSGPQQRTNLFAAVSDATPASAVAAAGTEANSSSTPMLNGQQRHSNPFSEAQTRNNPFFSASPFTAVVAPSAAQSSAPETTAVSASIESASESRLDSASTSAPASASLTTSSGLVVDITLPTSEPHQPPAEAIPESARNEGAVPVDVDGDDGAAMLGQSTEAAYDLDKRLQLEGQDVFASADHGADADEMEGPQPAYNAEDQSASAAAEAENTGAEDEARDAQFAAHNHEHAAAADTANQAGEAAASTTEAEASNLEDEGGEDERQESVAEFAASAFSSGNINAMPAVTGYAPSALPSTTISFPSLPSLPTDAELKADTERIVQAARVRPLGLSGGDTCVFTIKDDKRR